MHVCQIVRLKFTQCMLTKQLTRQKSFGFLVHIIEKLFRTITLINQHFNNSYFVLDLVNKQLQLFLYRHTIRSLKSEIEIAADPRAV